MRDKSLIEQLHSMGKCHQQSQKTSSIWEKDHQRIMVDPMLMIVCLLTGPETTTWSKIPHTGDTESLDQCGS